MGGYLQEHIGTLISVLLIINLSKRYLCEIDIDHLALLSINIFKDKGLIFRNIMMAASVI
jgi:hypothetical protein